MMLLAALKWYHSDLQYSLCVISPGPVNVAAVGAKSTFSALAPPFHLSVELHPVSERPQTLLSLPPQNCRPSSLPPFISLITVLLYKIKTTQFPLIVLRTGRASPVFLVCSFFPSPWSCLISGLYYLSPEVVLMAPLFCVSASGLSSYSLNPICLL